MPEPTERERAREELIEIVGKTNSVGNWIVDKQIVDAVLDWHIHKTSERERELEAKLETAIPALRMARRVMEDESELDDIEAGFMAVEMIDDALAQIDAGQKGGK